MTLFKELERLDENDHVRALTRVIVGALASCIEAHGPITKTLIGSAAKRVVGQLVASGKTRIAIPVITNEQLRQVERLAEYFNAAQSALEDSLLNLSCSLDVLRDENHPEGWTAIEFVERADVPVAIVHHHRLQRAAKQYQRKRDGKMVDLGDSTEAAEYLNQAGATAAGGVGFRPTVESPPSNDAVDPVDPNSHEPLVYRRREVAKPCDESSILSNR